MIEALHYNQFISPLDKTNLLKGPENPLTTQHSIHISQTHPFQPHFIGETDPGMYIFSLGIAMISEELTSTKKDFDLVRSQILESPEGDPRNVSAYQTEDKKNYLEAMVEIFDKERDDFIRDFTDTVALSEINECLYEVHNSIPKVPNHPVYMYLNGPIYNMYSDTYSAGSMVVVPKPVLGISNQDKPTNFRAMENTLYINLGDKGTWSFPMSSSRGWHDKAISNAWRVYLPACTSVYQPEGLPKELFPIVKKLSESILKFHAFLDIILPGTKTSREAYVKAIELAGVDVVTGDVNAKYEYPSAKHLLDLIEFKMQISAETESNFLRLKLSPDIVYGYGILDIAQWYIKNISLQ